MAVVIEPVLPDNKELEELNELVKALLSVRADMEAQQTVVDQLAEQEKHLEREMIPAQMQSMGLEEVRTLNGDKVTLKQDVVCSVAGKNRDPVMAWLDEIGAGDIIKTQMVVEFNKEEHEKARECAIMLREDFEFDVEETLSVHQGTFKALLKERLANGEPVPWERIGALAFHKANLAKTRR